MAVWNRFCGTLTIFAKPVRISRLLVVSRSEIMPYSVGVMYRYRSPSETSSSSMAVVAARSAATTAAPSARVSSFLPMPVLEQ